MHILRNFPYACRMMNRKWLHIPLNLMLWGYALLLTVYVVLRLSLGDGFWLLSFANNFAPYYFLPLVAALPLALWLRGRVLRVVMSALALLAVAWYAPRFIPNNAVRAAGETSMLKVVSFNVLGENARLDESVAWLLDADADILLLQETPAVIATDQVPELIDAYPYRVLSAPWGDTILSRYPLETVEPIDLENDGVATQVRATINLNGQTVALYNVHMYLPLGGVQRFPPPIDNPFVNMLAYYDDSARNAQIDQLLTLTSAEEHPYIVAGDFNMSDNAVKYQEIAAVMRDSQRDAGFGFGNTWPIAQTWGLPGLIPTVLRIDYIWHSDEFSARSISRGQFVGSDHLPVMATLELDSE